MRLLEVVRGAKTAPDVLATAMQIGKTDRQGRRWSSGVCHGFIGNRMLAQRQAQANALILEGAMPWDVDRVLYDFGFPMGPFQMADLAGLDIGWSKETSQGRDHPRARCASWTAAARRPAPASTTTTPSATPTPAPVPRRSSATSPPKKGITPPQDRRRRRSSSAASTR